MKIRPAADQTRLPRVRALHARGELRPRDLIILLALAAATLLAAIRVASARDALEASAALPAARNARVSFASQYPVPAVHLVRDDGKAVLLPEELNDGRAVVLNFIFTTCSSTCPLMSQTFAQFDSALGADRERVHLMSISTDPEEDTPARLREYAQKFHAGPEWQHYTGTLEASLAAQRAFNVWRGDKMSHTPVTLLRAAPGSPWVRIEGFVTPAELLTQYRHVVAQAATAPESTRTVATR
jgi:protein SCO1/2